MRFVENYFQRCKVKIRNVISSMLENGQCHRSTQEGPYLGRIVFTTIYKELHCLDLLTTEAPRIGHHASLEGPVLCSYSPIENLEHCFFSFGWQKREKKNFVSIPKAGCLWKGDPILLASNRKVGVASVCEGFLNL
jgi:hypothetical protein